MPIQKNPVDDKVRSARKRYGDQAALWGLLTALYASGRDDEANGLVEEFRSGTSSPSETLKRGLSLPELGRSGEVLVGWAAHCYQRAHSAGERSVHRVMSLLPQVAYSVMEWTQRARPRPNLFDYNVEEAYEAATEFLDGRAKRKVKQGPVVFRFDDGWTVQDLNTKALLVDEGNRQHICVGQESNGYPQRVKDGDIKIYSLRDGDGAPHVTMTWSNAKGIYESSREHNYAVIADDLRHRCKLFAIHVGMSEEKAERYFGALCQQAMKIRDSFDEDHWISGLSRTFFFRDTSVERDRTDDFLEHPVMDPDEFRSHRYRNRHYRLAEELAEIDSHDYDDDFYEGTKANAYLEGIEYLDAAVDAARRAYYVLRDAADSICSGDDPSIELDNIINDEERDYSSASEQLYAMRNLLGDR